MRYGEFTVGVEEEFQLIDPDDGALRGRAPELLKDGWPAKEEFQRTAIEIDTPVCTTAGEAGRRLVARRRALARLAASQGLAIAAAGLHPVGPYPSAQVSDVPDYRRIADLGGASARELHIFGLHVHVGVQSREAAIRAMCGVAPYLPHLLALSVSSPFYQAQDTSFDSFRTLLRDMAPRVGLPMPVVSAAEYDRMEAILAGGAPDPRHNPPIAWDVRPSLRYPTLEFRLFDAVPWIDTIELIVAMARALTLMYADRPPPYRTGTELQLMRDNRWRAARFGLDATFFRLDPVTGEVRSARDSILALVDRLAPIAERLGDGEALGRIDAILARGTAAAAMRAAYEKDHALPDVTRWVVAETEATIA